MKHRPSRLLPMPVLAEDVGGRYDRHTESVTWFDPPQTLPEPKQGEDRDE